MASYTIVPGQALTFAIGGLTFKIDGSIVASPLREDLLKYLFIKTVPAWHNETTPHTGPTDLYLSLHEGSPAASSETAFQTSNEITGYTGYARTAIVRTTSGWTVADAGSGDWGAKNAATVAFTANGGATNYVVNDLWIGLGTDSSGTGNLLFYGQCDATTLLTMSDGLETALLALLMQGAAPSWITGEVVGAYAGLYMSAYTAAYAHGDNQRTNEVDDPAAPATYTGFQRGQTGTFNTTTVATDAAVFNSANINMYSGAGLTAGGSTTPGFWRIGSAATGNGRVLLHGAATNPPVFVNGGTPKYAAGNVVIRAS